MSIDYSVSPAVGFIFDTEEVLKTFRRLTPAVVRKEKRFDSRTGLPIDDAEVVVKEAAETYVFGGRSFEDPYVLVDFLAKKLRCWAEVDGDDSAGMGGPVCFCPKIGRPSATVEGDGRFSVSGSYNWKDVAAAKGALASLASKLRKLGLKPKSPQVFVLWSIT